MSQKELSEELRQSRDLLAAILRGVEDAITVRERSGGLVYANEAAARILGFASVEELLSTTADELLKRYEVFDEAGDAIPADRRPSRQGLQGEESPPTLMRVRNLATGRERWAVTRSLPVVDDTGQVELAISIFRDITRRKRAEESRRVSDELFATVFRVNPAALWISDLLTGEAIDVNDSFLRMTGYSREEVIGHTTLALGLWVDTEDRKNLVAELRVRGFVRDMEVQICRRSGEVREALISAEMVDIYGQQCLLVNCSDVTERKRAAEELQRLSRRLLEIQENERLHIARELHDEIGQVLTAVQMNIEAIKRSPEGSRLGDRFDESIELIGDALQQVRDLSFDLRPSLLDDLGLVNALMWYVERQSERTGLDIEFTFDPSQARLPSNVETSCFRIAQEALTNVIRHAGAKRVWLTLRRHQGELELAVKDDGRGFDVGAARYGASGGSSLGLLSMQERAELVGGRLWIESEPGGGTIVSARLPLVGGKGSFKPSRSPEESAPKER